MSLDVSSFCEGKGTTRYLLVNLKTYPSHVYCRRQLAVFYDELAYSSWTLLDNDSIDNLGTWLVPPFVLVMIRVLLILCLIFPWKKECNVYTGNFNLKNYLYWIYKFMEIINESDKVVSLIILNKNKTFAKIYILS